MRTVMAEGPRQSRGRAATGCNRNLLGFVDSRGKRCTAVPRSEPSVRRCARLGLVPATPEASGPGIDSAIAQLFLDPDQLVVLSEPVRAREAAGLDLPAVGR